MNKPHTKHKLILIVSLFTILLAPLPAMARTTSEVQQDIAAKQKELDTLNAQLNTTQTNLQAQQQSLNSLSGELPRLQAELTQIESNLKYNQLQLQQLKLDQELKNLEYEEAEIKENKLIKVSYLGWKTGVADPNDLLASTGVKTTTYNAVVLSDGHNSLEELVHYLADLGTKIGNYEQQTADLNARTAELNRKKVELAARQAQVLHNIDDLSKQVNGIQSRAGSVQSELDMYYQEQRSIEAYEQSLLTKTNSVGSNGTNIPIDVGGPNPATTGIYFSGKGRDLYQGHGVGLSQFGALGAALKGWKYKDILKFYYQNTDVVVYKPDYKINVNGYGVMPIDNYVAGAAEVPTVACEDVGLQFDYNNIWRCWPREAIKAQAVAYRTYGIHATENGSSICTTTACQVFNGSQNMKWAATETAGEVVVYQGKPISAVYSSDNNQGAGTANNDTVFSNYGGDGTPYAYLRSVNDNAFAFRTSWSNYNWRTNVYTFTKLNEMLNYVNQDSELASSRTFINGVRNDIGQLTGMEFVKDPSGRVAKVVVIGTKGRRNIAGWLFKSIWNSWVYNVKPGGGIDYIYSLTFTMITT